MDRSLTVGRPTMSSFLYRTVTLPQERRAIAERAVEHYEIEDETPVEGGRRVTHWDTDGPDTLLAVFGAVFDEGIETISLHVTFEPGSTRLVDVHGLMVSSGDDLGEIPAGFMAEEAVRHEQEVLRRTMQRSKKAEAAPARAPKRL